jgi:kelch motif-containing protein
MSRKRLLGAVAVAASLAMVMGAMAQASGTHRRGTAHAVRGTSKALSLHAGAGARPSANYLPAGLMKTGVQENGGGAALGTKVYVPGGCTDTACTQNLLLGVMQTLNANTNKWSKDLEQMPIVADGTSPAGWSDGAVCADASTKKVYVVNGADGAFIYAATQVYDTTAPLGARWSYLSYPLLADGITTWFGQSAGCWVNQGKLYLFGGYAAIGDPNDPNLTAALTKTTWVYDIATDTWSDALKPMKKAVIWFGYGGDAKQAYALSGTDSLSTFIPVINAQRFKPATGWGAIHALPVGRLGPGMGVLGTGQTAAPALFGGGEWDPVGQQFLLHQDTISCGGGCPGTGAGWTDAALLLTTHRWFLAAASAGGKLYAAGGVGVPNGFAEVLRSAEKSA